MSKVVLKSIHCQRCHCDVLFNMCLPQKVNVKDHAKQCYIPTVKLKCKGCNLFFGGTKTPLSDEYVFWHPAHRPKVRPKVRPRSPAVEHGSSDAPSPDGSPENLNTASGG